MAFKAFFGNCIDCPPGKKSWIKVKSRRCDFHNHAFKQAKKAIGRIKPLVINPNDLRPANKWRKPKFRKPTGEKAVFELIFQNRPHRCQVCDRPITRKKDTVDIFSHVSSKGSNGVLRLDEEFILLMGDGYHKNCRCHPIWEARTNAMRKIEMWKPIFELLDAAKKKGHDMRKNKPLYENRNSQNHLESKI